MITNYKNKETGVFLNKHIFREKCALLLVAIPEKNIGVSIVYLSKKSDMTYSHAHKILEQCELAGIIRNPEKVGRERMIVLTEKGLKLKEHILEIFRA